MSSEGNELMDISEDEIFLKNFQSVYSAMTANPDCRSKAYPKNVLVRLEDIYDLNDRICEKFRTQYSNAGFSMNVVVSLKGREKLDFPNWKIFDEHNWTESSIITGMVLTWEIYIILPNYRVPQKHSLAVKISNGIKAEEFFALMLSGKLERVDEIEQNVCPIVAKIDFVDAGIGNEILNIVSEWVRGLKSSNYEKGKFMLLMQKYRRMFAFFVNYLTLFLTGFFSVQIIKDYILDLGVNKLAEISTQDAINVFEVFILCLAVCFVLFKISETLANFMFKLLSEYGGEHVFDVTKGDKNQQDDFRKKEKQDRGKFWLNLVVTICINILCGIVTYFLTKGR